MMDEDRKTPEEFLEVAKHEERMLHKGRLKIFLGMAAGVGKTYAMLEEAQQLKQEGVDLLVGTVDTHGREETAQVLEGLKNVPEKIVNYKGQEFRVLDLDEIIKLKPQLVLVDELAHSNLPGSRHLKRWQDVEEILDHGIDVYTTLNIQHIESLNDVIKGIVNFSVQERVPDSIVEKATSIRIVDLTPEELLLRLKEGKVYLGDQSKIAAMNFFQKDRLTALREIALRFAAEKVDHDLHEMLPLSDRTTRWKSREKLLVAVSHSPHSQQLIRSTRRLAFSLGASWIAVHINDGRLLSEEENNRLFKHLELARELGAEVITTNDPNIAEGIKRTALQRGVTQIILGRPPQKSFWSFSKGYSLLDKIALECPEIDVHVLGQERISKQHRHKIFPFTVEPHFVHYFIAFSFVGLLTGINWLVLPYIGYKVTGFIFLLGILGISLFFKKGPVLFASILYALIWNYLFIPPSGEFKFSTNEDTALLGLYLLTAIATGILVDRMREHEAMLAKRENSAQALYAIVRYIATAPSTEAVLKSVKERLPRIINGDFEILIKSIDDGLSINNLTRLLDNEKEKSTAIWVFEHGKEAGWSTDTLPSVQNLYIPLKSAHAYRNIYTYEVVGVLVYRPKLNRFLTIEEKNFLYTVGQQLANYLERSFSESRTHQHEQQIKEEKIYSAIVNSLSKQLTNPLGDLQNAINAAVEDLKDEESFLEKQLIANEIDKINLSSKRLKHLLDSVFLMNQLSESRIPVKKKKYRIKDIIKMSSDLARARLEDRKILINVQEDLPEVFVDFKLIEILLFHLLANAIESSPADSTIKVEAYKDKGMIVVSVIDYGLEIPPEKLEAIFEKFYRLPGTSSSGLGLGLSIAKKIAEMHQGYLKAENLPEKGTKFSLFLPIEEEQKDETR